MVCSQKVARQKFFNTFSRARKLAVNSILLLLFHDVISAACEQRAQQWLTLAVVSVGLFRVVVHARVNYIILFCLVFSNIFNVLSALFAIKRPSCRK